MHVCQSVIEDKIRFAVINPGGSLFIVRLCKKPGVCFRLVTLDGRDCTLAHTESQSPTRLGRYGINLDCLETIGLTALHKAVLTRKILIIDEIGLMQATSERFRQTFEELLSAPQPILGTIGLQSHEWLDTMKQKENVKLFELTQYNQ